MKNIQWRYVGHTMLAYSKLRKNVPDFVCSLTLTLTLLLLKNDTEALFPTYVHICFYCKHFILMDKLRDTPSYKDARMHKKGAIQTVV